ncbi:MAG: V-type ATP synthase subunit B [Myxococcota bacterium]
MRTSASLFGPILVVDRARDVGVGEVARILAPDGRELTGRVLEVDGERAVVQVFEGTGGLDLAGTRVRFVGEGVRVGLGVGLLGRVLDALGRPLDDEPPLLPLHWRDVNGRPLNPLRRRHPRDYVETGISAIDGLHTLLRGQKLPLFSAFGLPANRLAAQIATQARTRSGEGSEGFAVVFGAMGLTHREADEFRRVFDERGTLERTVLFLNLADDPSIERLLLPRTALTAAEYLAFDEGRDVLVILTDMTNYCESLREVATAREEIPGRRGYPGYMYTDLASLYERAGVIRGRAGSMTLLPILSMPDDDMTHPIPDLTGYITEGQVVLSRDLHREGVYPPIDTLASLSRLMNDGIGEDRTREDHRAVADQVESLYARGRDLRRLSAIIGEEALSDDDKAVLRFAKRFEQELIHQGDEPRSVEETLDVAWTLLADVPPGERRRLPDRYVERYLSTDE